MKFSPKFDYWNHTTFLDFTWLIRIDSKEQLSRLILAMDEVILLRGYQYHLFMCFPPELIATSRIEELTHNFIEQKSQFLQTAHLDENYEGVLLNVYNYLETDRKYTEDFLSLIYVDNPVTNQIEEFTWGNNIYVNNTLGLSPLGFWSNYRRDELCLEMGFTSDYQFWFQKMFINGDWHENSKVAYLNTPRLNSFFRKIGQVASAYANLTIDTSSELYGHLVTPQGILLDGQIIYQEDIDEGRVKLPDA